MVKLIAEKSGLPTIAAINGVSRSLVKAETTVAKAAPTTTPTAMSTTLPRRMNCLKPLSIGPPDGTKGITTCEERQWRFGLISRVERNALLRRQGTARLGRARLTAVPHIA